MKIIALVSLLALCSCRTPTAIGFTLDVPLFGHMDLHADPVKAVVTEAAPVTDAVGLTKPVAPTK